MQSATCESYLVTEVLTSTPQKLQLLLIEGAIRAIERTRQKWRAGDDEQAAESLIRAQEIVAQMLAGLNTDVDPELVKKVAAVYVYIFRSLVDSHLERDEKRLDDALRVLEVERGTWREVCARLGGRHPAGGDAYLPQASPTVPPPSKPANLAPGMTADLPSAGFSAEA
jgi:flagellar protein FliS